MPLLTFIFASVYLLILTVDAELAAGSGWWDGFYPAGLDGEVYAVACYNDLLVVGGEFRFAGDLPVNNIACWDGESWHGLRDGCNAPVRALHVLWDQLIAAGDFTSPAQHVAAWDGDSWNPLDSGTNDLIYALGEYQDELIAGGSFTEAGGVPVGYVARWNGESWGRLDSGTNAPVYALCGGSSGLVAGGSFTIAGGLAASHVASWNGASWEALGSGTNGDVLAVASFYGDLIAGGSFTSAGGVGARHVARWTGSAWTNLGAGTDQPVQALLRYGGDLFAGGGFSHAGGIPASCVARWTGAEWTAVGRGMDGPVHALALCPEAGWLVAGGSFLRSGDAAARSVATWDRTAWSGVGMGEGGAGASGPVLAFATYDGAMVAGGVFTLAGGTLSNCIARWDDDDHTWTAFGSGLGPGILALAEYHGDLVAGGDFETGDGAPASYIARWNGSQWLPLGGGVDGPVRALAVHNGVLAVGGDFLEAGGEGAPYFALWDGAEWSSPRFQLDGPVRTFGSYQGDLAVGGDFHDAWIPGEPPVLLLNHLARWDGNSWGAIGTAVDVGTNGPVYAVAEYNGDLIIGGDFYKTVTGHVITRNIVRWTGGQWTTAWGYVHEWDDTGADGVVLSLAVYGRQFVAGGAFTELYHIPVNRIAIHYEDSQIWDPMGEGMDSTVIALHRSESDDNLYVGGAFIGVDGLRSSHIARWPQPPAGIDEEPLESSHPSTVDLAPATPNPLRDHSMLTYYVPEAGDVRLAVFDVRGRRVRTLVDGPVGAGSHSIGWNGTDSHGCRLASGSYCVRLEALGRASERKLTLLRTE